MLAEPDDPGLPDDAIDVFFLCDAYHHIEDRIAYIDELRRDLSPTRHVA